MNSRLLFALPYFLFFNIYITAHTIPRSLLQESNSDLTHLYKTSKSTLEKGLYLKKTKIYKDTSSIIKGYNYWSEKEKSTILSKNIIISILSTVSLFGVIYYYRQHPNRKKFLRSFNKTAKQDCKKEQADIPESCPINQKTLNNLLKRLQQFEEKKEYLKPNLNTKDLAKSFGSNSSYLSKAVNTYKEKSFSNYINDLRIDFVIDKLRKDTIFRKYKIKAIAQEVGFNNSEAFSKAFYKKTNIYPSSFIKELEKDKNNSNFRSGNKSQQKSH